MYYIYEYIDPRTSLPFYIGKGKNNRKYNHLKNEKESKHENPDKFQIIQDILAEGLFPVIREIESNIEKESDAYAREDHYIFHYGRKGIDKDGILTNKTLHGHPPTPVWDDNRKQKHSEWNSKYWTEDRKLEHRKIAKENAIKGGLASKGTVSVVGLTGLTKRIPKELYLSIDKSIPVEQQEFVSTSSKEGKRRLTLPTLGPVVATVKPPGSVREISLVRVVTPV
jgi:hypothetical protein